LLNLANGRKQYARFLSFFQKKFGIEVLDQVITKMKYAGSKWNTIRGFLIKYKMVGRLSNKNKEELAQSILEIKMIEQEIWYELKAFIKKEDIYTMNHVQEKKIYEDNQVYEHEYIDIREMCNNNGIGNSISSECETDLTGTGHYFYSDTSKNTIVKKDIFEFYINFNERFDNISCKGQTIKINNLVARKIAILACAEWGDFLDRIKIVYDDGTSSYLYIELNDWWKQPNLGYTVVWSGKVVEKEEGTAKLLDEEGRYMCGKIYELEDKKLIQEITLPICPNIHIFGITIHI
ncbi:hypothetical protein, partial [Anaerosporobacter sp.]|uniref:hypothetical protein n=1 Tax=Anaerosporobacter sp. TaxID=1872529 RepID=UPI00286EFABC